MKKFLITFTVVGVVLFITWATTFVGVVQPMGILSKGKTIWVWKPDRLIIEEDIPFFCSAKGMTLAKTGELKLWDRGMAHITLARIVSDGTVLIRLPYIDSLHSYTLNGKGKKAS